MTAYVVFCTDRIGDRDAIRRYRAAAIPTLAASGGRVIAGPATAATLEGAGVDALVIVEFESVAAARAWYDSPAYRAATAIRHAGSEGRAFIVEGRA